MDNVIQFRRRTASSKVIAKLVELGYLRSAKRHKAGAIENAIARLRQDLYRDGIIGGGDLSRPQLSDSKKGQEKRGMARRPAFSSSGA